MTPSLRVLALSAAVLVGCGGDDPGGPSASLTTPPSSTSSTDSATTGTTAGGDGSGGHGTDASTDATLAMSDPDATYYSTLGPGAELPTGEDCAEEISTVASEENRPENAGPNSVALGVAVDIDGADDRWNEVLAPRINGEFTGTTEQILRWGACKWGFDEDLTRARAVTESSWRMATAGDETDDPAACELLSLTAPCAQSYGLLQVKATVHEGTYPTVLESSAFGVDYAMAWLRACYEGSFTWLDNGYAAGDEWGCIGAWFSGNWWDQPANDYVGEVRYHLAQRTWEQYAPG